MNVYIYIHLCHLVFFPRPTTPCKTYFLSLCFLFLFDDRLCNCHPYLGSKYFKQMEEKTELTENRGKPLKL
jgi:hypothetical protein